MSETAVVPDPAADVVRLKALLTELQWSGPVGVTPVHRSEPTCPDCGGFQTYDGHGSTCRILPELT